MKYFNKKIACYTIKVWKYNKHKMGKEITEIIIIKNNHYIAQEFDLSEFWKTERGGE